MRILLFDDNGVLRALLRRLLLKQGWEVLTFPDPVACPLYHCSGCACELAEVCADAIVTDFDMPNMDGLCFVQQLLAKGCKVKHVALLSETRNATALNHAGQLGFKVFSKTDGIPALLEWLRQVEGQLETGRQLTRWAEA